ncbi:hypothetical protein MTO96_030992 [Rhipicephalus appendiculatus]
MNAAMIHRRTPLLSADDWSAALLKYWNITANANAVIMVYNSRYFDAVFNRHKVVGREKFAQFYGWLCVQALVPFTNKHILSHYYAPRDPILSHRQYCLAETRHYFPGGLEANILREEYERNDLQEVTRDIVRAMGDAEWGRPFNHGSCSDALREATSRDWPLVNVAHFDTLPDMSGNPLINWSRMKSAVPSPTLKGEGTPAPSEREQSILSGATFEDLDPSFYSPDIPSGATYGGLGLRVAAGLVMGFLGTRTGCRRLHGEDVQASAEVR